MDPKVMELRIRQWMPVFEEQAKSELNKDEWCAQNGINRTSFFRWQKRVRAYLLDHSDIASQIQDPTTGKQVDHECFVELPCTQIAAPGTSAPRNPHDVVMKDDAAPISIHYGSFSVNVDGEVDEKQLAAVLRVLKNVD